MIHAMTQGTLVGAPVERTSQKGTRFATASLRVPVGGEVAFVSLTAFDEAAVARLLELHAGSGVAATGELQLNNWTAKDGTERSGWRLIATEVLSVNQARRRRATEGEA